MVKRNGWGLSNNYRSPLLLVILVFSFLIGHGQATYNPAQQPGMTFVVNKPFGESGPYTLDARSYKADSLNFAFNHGYRPFNGVAEVLSYFPVSIPAWRTGQFPIEVNIGGALQSNGTFIGGQIYEYWWRNGQADSQLVLKAPISAGVSSFNTRTGAVVPQTGDYTFAQIGSPPTTIAGYGITDGVTLTGTQTLTNKTMSGSSNTFSNIPNSALTSSTVGLTLDTAGTAPNVSVTPAALGGNLTLSAPFANASKDGFFRHGDWNYFFAKVDSTSLAVTLDSVFDWHNGSKNFRYKIPPGSGAVLSVSNADPTMVFSPTTGNVLGRVNTASTFAWTGLHSWTAAPSILSFTSNGGVLYTNGSGLIQQVPAGTSSQILQGGTAPAFFTPTASTVNGWLGYPALSNALGSTHIFVGNGSNIATDVPLTGDAAILITGALTNNGLKGAALPSLAPGNLKYTGTAWTFDNTSYQPSLTFQQSIVNNSNVVNLVNDLSTSPSLGNQYNYGFDSTGTRNFYQNKYIVAKKVSELRTLRTGDTSLIYRTIINGLVSDFYWNPTSTVTDDSVMFIKTAATTGRLMRYYKDYVLADWWGLKGDGVTDDSYYAQKAINFAVSPNSHATKLKFLGKIYLVKNLVIYLRSLNGTDFDFVTLTLEGVAGTGNQTLASGAITVFKNTDTASFILGAECARNVFVNNIAFAGPLASPASYKQVIENSNAQWLVGGIRNNINSPGGTAFIVDPFSASVPSANQYAGLSAFYTNTSTRASSMVTLDGCTITNFNVGIAVGINGITNNCDNISFKNGTELYNRVFWASGQNQSRDNSIINLYGSGFNQFFIDCNDYGTNQGSAPDIYYSSINGVVKYLYAINGPFAGLNMIGGRIESMYSLGVSSSGASLPVSFYGTQIQLGVPGPTGGNNTFAPTVIASGGPIQFIGASLEWFDAFTAYGWNFQNDKVSFTNARISGGVPTNSGQIVTFNDVAYKNTYGTNLIWESNNVQETSISAQNNQFIIPGTNLNIYNGVDNNSSFTYKDVGDKIEQTFIETDSIIVDSAVQGAHFITLNPGQFQLYEDITTTSSISNPLDIFNPSTGVHLGWISNIVADTVTLSYVPYGVITRTKYPLYVTRLQKFVSRTTGNTTSGSNVVKGLQKDASTTFAAGMHIKGAGIPVGAYVVSVSSVLDTLVMSVNATATANNVPLYDAQLLQTSKSFYPGVYFQGDVIELSKSPYSSDTINYAQVCVIPGNTVTGTAPKFKNVIYTGTSGAGPGGNNGDVQINNSGTLGGSLLNQTNLKITYLSDSDFVFKSVNNPNQFNGLSFRSNTGVENGGFKINTASGLMKLGGFNTGYIPAFYSGGSEGMRLNADGLNIGFAGDHGERLYVVGQSYLNGIAGINSAPTNGASLTLPAGTTTVAPLKITTTSSALLTTPIPGSVESLADSLYWTGNSGTRYKIVGGNNVVNIYNSDGTLTANRTVNSGGFNLTLGSNVAPFPVYNLFATNLSLTTSGSGQYINFNGPAAFLAITTVTADANYISNTDNMIVLNTSITATRTITLPTASNTGIIGRPITIINHNSTSSGWTFASTVSDGIGNTVTNIPNGAVFIVISDGVNWRLISVSYGGGQQINQGNLTISSGTSSTAINYNTNILFDPASVIASYTLTLPSNPADGALVKIHSGGTITGTATVVTAFTVSPNTGQTIMQKSAPTTLLANDVLIYQYNLATSRWYREQ